MSLDAQLTEALTAARAIIRSYFCHDLWEAEIDWEQPAMWIAGEPCETDAQVSHAIGFVHGVALALNTTALALLDEVPDDDVTYRCACSWVGGDPDVRIGKPPTCPACWKHERRRVPVVSNAPAIPTPTPTVPATATANPYRPRSTR